MRCVITPHQLSLLLHCCLISLYLTKLTDLILGFVMAVIISSQVRISRRRLIPRIRGTVDCLKPEGNPTHASILALGSIAPSTVVSKLI